LIECSQLLLAVWDFFPGQVSSFVGHKFIRISGKVSPLAFFPHHFKSSWDLFWFSFPVFVALQRFDADF